MTSELTVHIDNLAADLASLQHTAPAVPPPILPVHAAPAVPPPIVPIRGLPTRALVVSSLPPTPYQSPTGLPSHSGGQQSCNGGHQNFGRGGKKRLGPDHAAVAKRPRNEMVNPAHAQCTSSSAHPMGNQSAVIIGPSILAHHPSDVFAGILALLPESAFYNTDHLSCSQEDSDHVRVCFCNHDTASRLCTYWSQVNPLAGTPHNMTNRGWQFTKSCIFLTSSFISSFCISTTPLAFVTIS